jgi:hypothetical protein
VLENNNFSVKNIFGKEKVRIMNLWREEIKKNGYTFWIERLTLESLINFYNTLYISFIKQKEKAIVFPLIERLEWRIQQGEEIFFGCIKKEQKLLAGGIFFHKQKGQRKGISLWYRAYDEQITIHNLKLGYYIEYLFYQFGIEYNVDFFSRGKDRNWYGYLGTSIWISLHKIELHHLPYPDKEANFIEIDEDIIKQDSLFFLCSEQGKFLSEVRLYCNKSSEEIERIYGIVGKRWFALNIISYNN